MRVFFIVCLPTYLSSVRPPTYLIVYQSITQWIHQLIDQSIYPFIHLSIYFYLYQLDRSMLWLQHNNRGKHMKTPSSRRRWCLQWKDTGVRTSSWEYPESYATWNLDMYVRWHMEHALTDCWLRLCMLQSLTSKSFLNKQTNKQINKDAIFYCDLVEAQVSL